MSLCAESLSYRADGRLLLGAASLRLHAGRVHAVLGANGAGKSTLLRLLAGELRPETGRITLNGRDLTDWSARERALQRAVLPQGESLSFGFTAEQVVALGRLPCRQHDERREREIVHEALQAADVAPLAQRIYPTLSGGERARVQFARVLAQIWEPVDPGPRFLLLDEPTASLDLAHQHSLLATARRFAAQDIGVLAVLHDPNLALAYADEATLLKEGRVLAQGDVTPTLTAETLSQLYDVTVRKLRDASGSTWFATTTRSQASMAPQAAD